MEKNESKEDKGESKKILWGLNNDLRGLIAPTFSVYGNYEARKTNKEAG